MTQRIYAWLWRHPRVHLELYELTGYFVMGELPRRMDHPIVRFSLHKGR